MKYSFLIYLLFSLLIISCKGSTSENGVENEDIKYENLVESITAISDSIKICTVLTDTNFTEEDYANIISDKYFEIIQSGDTSIYELRTKKDKDRFPASAAGIIKHFWPSKTKLKVQFLEGDPSVIERVKQSAKKWEEYASIRFDFGTFSNPDITISFNPQSGSWSYVGVQSKKFRPSMNFGWLKPNTSDIELDRVVLHEFGHALGLIHEHQNPNNNPIQWNEKKTYLYYRITQGWTEEDVRINVFEKYSTNQLVSTGFDPKSIMLYAVPSSLTTDGYSTTSNSSISELDKKLIREIYY